MIPVLIVGYKRVDEIDVLIRKSIEFGAVRLYVAIDLVSGQSEIMDSVKERVNKIKQEFPVKEITTWYRDSNLGSALSVISAIDWVFQFEESLAVIEDDLEISESLLQFLDSRVAILRSDPRILMVSGCNPFREIFKEKTAGYSHYPVVWGWATTRDKWLLIKTGILSSDFSYGRGLDLRVKNFLETGRLRAQSRLIDAWDVPLSGFMRGLGYKCLIPGANLVSNLGFDKHATHTTTKVWPLGSPLEKMSGIPEDYTEDYDKLMESLIFKIKWYHTFSKLRIKLLSVLNLEKLDTKLLRQALLEIPIPQSGVKEL